MDEASSRVARREGVRALEPTVAPTGTAPVPNDELGRAARGGAATLVGSGASALLGFLFTLMLARTVGAASSGVVLQAVAAFTIALSLTKLGLDTAAVWMLPRLTRSEPERVRAAVVGILLPGAVASLLASSAWFVIEAMHRSSERSGSVTEAISVVALFLPAATIMTVALAATRGFGGVLPFNLIGNIAVPVMRPLGLVVVFLVGGGSLAATTSWSVPWLAGMVLALLVLGHQLLHVTKAVGGRWWPDPDLMRRLWRYSLPRTLMSGLEQTVVWLDVILVGVILGENEAGVYGTAARFVAAGVIVLTAMRIAVAPRFSVLIAEARTADLKELYIVTAQWVLLLGTPVYLILAVFSPTVLGWLGTDFSSGVSSMVILSLGSIVMLAGGNVQSLLLMSGHSAWGALNKVVVVAFNVVGNLVLLPRMGIEGAALTWAASMALDTALAAWQVRRAVGVSLAVRDVLTTTVTVSLCVAVPAVSVILLAGQGLWQLLTSVVAGGLLLLAYCAVDRRRLRMDELLRLGRKRGEPGGTGLDASMKRGDG